ncbi:MAG: hypothetical protein WHV66_12555, partial [Anaerolineales bacterium]
RLLPNPNELGLSVHVVQAFEDYIQNPPEPARRRRLPRLAFDPYTPAFNLLLPSQPVPLEQAGFLHRWEVCLFRNGEEVCRDQKRVRIRRSGQEYQTEEIEWMIEEPVEQIQVALVYCENGEEEEKIAFRWTLRVVPADNAPPLLAFHAGNRQLRRPTPALPAQMLWLLYPVDCELQMEGQPHKVGALHPFAEPWHVWQAQLWELSRVSLIRVLKDGREVCPPVPVTAPQEPQLIGQEIHPQNLPLEEKQLYHTAPALKLPLRHLEDAENQLASWKLKLASHYAAQPAVDWEETADNLPYQLLEPENAALVEIDRWLQEPCFGTYHLAVSHAAYGSFELPFRIWSEIKIEGLKPYYLPGTQGAEPVVFSLELPETANVTSLGTDSLEVNNTDMVWQVTVPPELDQADLRLELPASPEPVRVPLRLAVPRLRWSLRLETASPLEWQHRPISVPLAQVLQNRSPSLLLDLPVSGGESLVAELCLKIPEQSEPLMSSPQTRQFDANHRRVEFDLGAFSDTLRHYHDQSVFTFVLQLLGTANVTLELPVLHLTQQLDVRACYFESLPGGRWRVHWHEPNPLRHRCLRLWSLWQPWADPVEISLPDHATPSADVSGEGWWMADLPEEIALPPAHYKAQFIAIAPEDRGKLPAEPPEGALKVELISEQERLRQIAAQLDTNPRNAFALHFERACIYYEIGYTECYAQDVQWCISNWRQSSLLHLYALQRWLKPRDHNSASAVLLYMYRHETLQKLKTLQRDFVEKYLASLREVKVINPESAHLLLELSNSPFVIRKALEALVKARDDQAVEYLWNQAKAGNLSERDAAQVLSAEPEFAIASLLNCEDTPLRRRLMLELSRYYPIPDQVVRLGYWVLCTAGWGKIIQIENVGSDEYFLLANEKPR